MRGAAASRLSAIITGRYSPRASWDALPIIPLLVGEARKRQSGNNAAPSCRRRRVTQHAAHGIIRARAFTRLPRSSLTAVSFHVHVSRSKVKSNNPPPQTCCMRTHRAHESRFSCNLIAPARHSELSLFRLTFSREEEVSQDGHRTSECSPSSGTPAKHGNGGC